MKVLHRTPVHHELLSKVQAGLVQWRSAEGLFGRFARWGGQVFTGPAELVALYELRDAGLIRVEGEHVRATENGAARLGQWSVIR